MRPGGAKHGDEGSGIGMELAWAQAFAAVAECGSFSAAAESLFVAQSVVSKRVQKLEQQLGVRLLDRSRRQVELTAAGRSAYPCIRALLEEYRQLEQAVHPAGLLRLALLPVADCYAIPQRLAEFAAARPGLELRLEERENTAAAALLKSGRCDGAFYRTAESVLPEGALGLWREELVLLAPGPAGPGGPAGPTEPAGPAAPTGPAELDRSAESAGPTESAGPGPVPLTALRQERFLLLSEATGLYEASMGLFRQAGFRPQIGYTGASAATIARMVRGGAGVALLCRRVAESCAGPGLRILTPQPTCQSTVLFQPSAAGQRNPAMPALLAFLRGAGAANRPYIVWPR